MKPTLLLCVLFISAIAFARCASVVEKNALLDLYTSTNGPNWLHGWNVSADPCTSWFGITCSVSGAITAVILDFNHLDGSIPNSISNLTSMVTLDLSNNFLSGSIPQTIGASGSPPSLVSIDLSSNIFSGTIPAEIFQLPGLRSLSLKVNQLSGPLPDNLGTSVTALYLSNNLLSGSLEPLDTLTSLQQLYLDNNHFSVMTNTTFPQLLNLQVSNNPNLHPILPDDLNNVMSLLQQISMSNTGMSQTIPASIGGLASLTVLDLSDNTLVGTIPSSIGSDVALQYLNLSGCDLSGPIPDSFSSLTNLISLDLSHNSLNGSVPVFLSSPVSFNLTIQCNHFCTPLPSWCASSKCSSCGFTASPCTNSSHATTTSVVNSTGHATTSGSTTGSSSNSTGPAPPESTTTGGRGTVSPTTSTTHVYSASSSLTASAAFLVAVLVAQLV